MDILKYTIEESYVDFTYENETFKVNEYTLRNIQVHVKNGELDHNKITIFDPKSGLTHHINQSGLIRPNFKSDFYSKSYDLSFKLVD